MTDPAKTDDIEDVLSSIRRLVAENAKATQEKDALVLTQKHRVQAAVPPAPQAQAPSRVSVAQPAPLSASSAAVRSTPVAAPTPVAPTPGPDAGQRRAEPTFARPAEPAPAQQRSPIVADRTIDPIPPAPSALNLNIPKDTAQGSHAAVAPQADGTVSKTGGFRFTMVKPTAAPKPDPAPQVTLSDPADAPAVEAESLEDAIAEAVQETVMKKAVDDIEVMIAPDQNSDPQDGFATEKDLSTDAIDDAAMDFQVRHDAMKAMVGEMIREELRGEMGEKITRNVRKLVRREIQRALTSQQLD